MSKKQIQALASTARTASENSADIINDINKPGAHVIIDVTALSLTPSVVFTLQGKDLVSGKYYDIIESAAVTAVGTTVLTVRPGVTVAANLSASNCIPRVFRINAAHADTDSITYSVGINLLD